MCTYTLPLWSSLSVSLRVSPSSSSPTTRPSHMGINSLDSLSGRPEGQSFHSASVMVNRGGNLIAIGHANARAKA
ncbi:hypothetical protein DMENIID0001_076940 [Sergentomyia squamirostris]